MSERKIPSALYGCADDDCAVEVTYPPDMLYWSEKMQGWYCENCFEHVDELVDEDRGISLDKYLNHIAEQQEAELVEVTTFLRGQLDELINRHYGGNLPCNDEEQEGFEKARTLLAKREQEKP